MKDFVKTSIFNRLESSFKQKSNFIQVILGPRQVGKTTTVLHFLKEVYGPRHLYVSADSVLNADFNWLAEKWQEARKKADLLVVDEIQKVENWAEIVKKLWDEDRREERKLRCLFLGSSSLDIQKGLSESLTGRFQLIQAYHWNFSETNKLHSMDFEEYLKFGGYPGSYALLPSGVEKSQGSDQVFIEYLQNSIVSTVIEKDILNNHTVKSPALFKQAFELILSYPAQIISYTKLLGQLQDKGNTDLIKYYIQLYEGAFLLKQVFKFSPKPLKRKTSSPKLIPLCPALYYLTIQDEYRTDERGRVFESLVGSSLNRLPLEMYYWREGRDEVDFVLKKGRKLWAVEVKSGRRKPQKGVEKFCQKFPEAKPLFITPENYGELEEKGLDFLP